MNDLSPRFLAPALDALGTVSTASHSQADADVLAVLSRSRLLDAAWYAERHPDVAASGLPPALHFHRHGWREGRWPNPYFDTAFYLRGSPDLAATDRDPLLHYIETGETEGRAPCEFFDLLWYRSRHGAPARDGTLLAQFLARRTSGTVSPLPEFDPAWYLAANPDVADAGVDPFEHWLNWGYREGRDPSPGFSTRYYVRRYLDGSLDRNPLLHYRRFRSVTPLRPVPPPGETNGFDEVRRFTRPGPLFEARAPLPRSAPRQAKVLAFYLPQFHPIPENDRWWGAGFTEWTSVARGQPRFAGHYQPRIPRDLGPYRLDAATQRRQTELARDGGVHGFVHYFYWFNGRRLLEQPTETMLADPTIDFPFALMWANENWTRRWDGSEQDVLISQDYARSDEPALIDTFARHFADSRYIRVAGRPLLMVYRADLVPDPAATVARWRALWRERHGEDPWLVMAQSFEARDPRPLGFDAAVEFPPHKLTAGPPRPPETIDWLDPSATTRIHDYADVVAASLAEPTPDYPLIKTAVPGWDNDARRQGKGLALRDATPTAYEGWMRALAGRPPSLGNERIVCVNAWNEWAEGAYLEPDVHFGAAFLNATARAIASGATGDAPRVLLVGHDAFPAGAQMLLLHIGQRLAADFGLRIEFALLDDGALRSRYEEVAPTRIITDPNALVGVSAEFEAAIVNTVAAGRAAAALARSGTRVTMLVHEMTRLISDRRLDAAAREGTGAAARVVFATNALRTNLAGVVDVDDARAIVLPQGCYRPIVADPGARAALRARLGAGDRATLVLGAGHGDLRKGFDLFLQVWRAARRRTADVVGAWVGAVDPSIRAWLAPEIEAAEASGALHLPGHVDDPAPWFAAADAFLLTSREDPFPSVALEAMSCGLPVIAFAGAGGMTDVIDELKAGTVVPMGDAEAMAEAALRPRAADRAEIAEIARRRFDFGDYATRLLDVALPDVARVSVAVTNHNHAPYLGERLASVFGQSYPVREVTLFDDGSIDDSLAVADVTAIEWRRRLRVCPRAAPTGTAWGRWAEATGALSGDWIWIAEGDDSADPGMLARLISAARAAPDAVLAACDSRSVDGAGAPVWPDYQGYYTQFGGSALARDGVWQARDFARRFLMERNLLLNVSAVLWRRDALAAALGRIGNELSDWQLAGDWRVYLELLAESDGTVAWVAAPLNVHRRHPASVTARGDARRLADEVARVRALAASRLTPADRQPPRGTGKAARIAG